MAGGSKGFGVKNGSAVAAVIVVHNGERRLRRAVASIRSQTVCVDELLIVVKPSVDQTMEIAESVPGATVLEQRGTGIGNARNLAVSATEADIVAFLDHDDVWHPLRVARGHLARSRRQP